MGQAAGGNQQINTHKLRSMNEQTQLDDSGTTTTMESRELIENLEADTLVQANDTVIIYRSPLAEAPRIFLLVVLYIATIYFTNKFPITVHQISIGSLFGYDITFGLPLLGLLPLMLMGNIVVRLMNYKYVLTPDYVLEIEGLMALVEKSVRLHYIHLRGIEIERSVLQKLFNLGDLRLGSAIAQGDAEIVMKGIYNPRRVKDIINERMIEQNNLQQDKPSQELIQELLEAVAD
jgi:uncharacterized membrane protein YdbT with pleckstrin-like domain